MKYHSNAAPELFGWTEDVPVDDAEHSTVQTQESDVYAFGCLYYEVSYLQVLAKYWDELRRSITMLYLLGA